MPTFKSTVTAERGLTLPAGAGYSTPGWTVSPGGTTFIRSQSQDAGVVLSGTFTYAHGGVQHGDTSAGSLYWRARVPGPCVLNHVGVYFSTPTGHGALPASLPGASVSIRSFDGAVVQSGINLVDASGDVPAYEGDNRRIFNTIDLPVTVPMYATMYFDSESGANAIAGLVCHGMYFNCAFTQPPVWW